MITQAVHASGFMKVEALAQLADVSEITIRRDLADLASRGVVRRTQGGAARTLKEGEPVPFAVRYSNDREVKTLLGVAGASKVADYESVIIDSGTTPYAVALELSGRPVTALALSLHSAVALGSKQGTQVIVPGGPVQVDTLAMSGSAALDSIRSMQADVFVLGFCGLTSDGGLTAMHYEEAQIKKAAIAASKRVVLVSLGENLGRTANFRFGSTSDITDLITTKDADPETVRLFEMDGVKVTRVE